MEKKIIIARIKVKQEKVEDFLELTKPLIASTRQESGNEVYSLYQMPEDPTEFIFYEEYKDQASIDSHNGSSHFRSFAEGVKQILARQMYVKVY